MFFRPTFAGICFGAPAFTVPVSFHYHVLDCLCLKACQDDSRYPQAPTDSKYLNAGGQVRQSYTSLETQSRCVSKLSHASVEGTLDLLRLCCGSSNGYWPKLRLCEKGRQAVTLCAGRLLLRSAALVRFVENTADCCYEMPKK